MKTLKKKRFENEIILDEIIKKFNGDKRFAWTDTEKTEWYYEINNDYAVIKYHIDKLIYEDYLEDYPINLVGETQLWLTKKGRFTNKYLSAYGFVALKRKENKKRNTKRVLSLLSVLTFFFVTFRFINDFVIHKPQNNLIQIQPTQKAIQSKITTKLDSSKEIYQINKDTSKIKILPKAK